MATTRPRCTGTVEECVNPACLWRGGNRPDRPCTKCGAAVHARPCRRWPLLGATVCSAHGGAAPHVTAAGLQRHELDRINGQAAALYRQLDQPDLHPLDGLLDAVRVTGTWARVFGHLTHELDLHPQARLETVGDGYNAGGDTGERWRLENNPLYGPDHKGDGKPHVLVEMHRVWLDQHTKACKLALDAGIDERRIQLAETEIDQLQQAVMVGIGAADLDADQMARFTAAFVEALRGLTPP